MLDLVTVAMHASGTFSALVWNGVPFAVSVECAPPVLQKGLYDCKRDYYHHGGYETFEIQVFGHDRVLFHKGNKGKDSKACVCVAENFAMFDDGVGVADSAHGFMELMQLTKGLQTFSLRVSGR